MQLLLNLVSRLFGLDLEFNFWGVFLFLVAVVIPVYAMVQCALCAAACGREAGAADHLRRSDFLIGLHL